MKYVFICTLLASLTFPALAQNPENEAAPASGQETLSQTEKNKALVMRFYEEAWHNDNYAVADEIFAPDYIRHDNSDPVQAGNAPLQSDIARRIKAIVPDLRFHYEVVLAEDDLVAVRWNSTGTPVGFPSFMRRLVGKSGPVETSGVNMYRIENDKVVEIWNNRDDLTRYREMGLFRSYVIGGFLAGVLITLLGSWVVGRRRASRSGA